MKSALISLICAIFISHTYSQSVSYSDIADSLNIIHTSHPSYLGTGVSFVDFNRDGWDDLTYGTSNNDSIYFYQNNSGNFTKIPSLFDVPLENNQVLWIDIDNDGDLDAFVSNHNGQDKLFENTGSMQFTDITATANITTGNLWTISAASTDFDRDGYMDIYVIIRSPAVPHSNILFRNNGDKTFSDVTDSMGVGDLGKLPLGVAFLDYDRDGWEDIYIAQDREYPGTLFKNYGGAYFEDVAVESNSAVVICGMCVNVGDYDNSGTLDIYVTNGIGGNKLLKNNGDGTFTELADSLGVGFNGVGWGSQFMDYDLDNDLDLYVSGSVVGSGQVSSLMYENINDSIFVISSGTGFIGDTLASYSNAIGDLNNDGYIDLAVSNSDSYLSQLWFNDGNNSNHWIRVKLTGHYSNFDGVGSWIEIYHNGRKDTRYMHAGFSYKGQNSYTMTIGLGTDQLVDSLIITWPSGIISKLTNIASGQLYNIPEINGTLPELIIHNSSIHPQCHGDTVILSISDPNLYSSLLWSTGDTTGSITVTVSGDYSVQGTRKMGFPLTSDTLSLQMGPNANSTVTHVNCYGNANGSIISNPFEGIPPYSFLWSTGDTLNSIFNLMAGTYFLTVTDSRGCEDIDTHDILQPDLINIQFEIVPEACGQQNGILTAWVTGGNGQYNYQWSNGQQDTNSISGLTSGQYFVTVNDHVGCTGINQVLLPQLTNPNINIQSSDLLCYNIPTGIANAQILASNGPVNYEWSNGDTVSSITSLSTGQYYLTITDSLNCVSIDTAVIDQPDPISTIATTVAETCGQSNGEISIAISGGTNPYQINWNNSQTGPVIQGIPAGNYQAVITDINGCTDSLQEILLNETGLIISSSNSDLLCYGDSSGKIVPIMNSGKSPFNFLWSDGKTDSINVGCEAGNYQVTVTDSEGCTDSLSMILFQPDLLNTIALMIPVNCFGEKNGRIEIYPDGGISPYSYNWDNANQNYFADSLSVGSYSYSVTDINNCLFTENIAVTQPDPISLNTVVDDISCYNLSDGSISVNGLGGTPGYQYIWDNNDTIPVIQALSAGIYSVTITDGNGCSDSAKYFVKQPDSIQILTINKNLSCYNDKTGEIELIINGGIDPYSVLWNDGDTSLQRLQIDAGNYSATINDQNGCHKIIQTGIIEPDSLGIIFQQQDITCFGGQNGQLLAILSGGTSPYQYFWSNSVQSDRIINLSAGMYQITVSDTNGCQKTAQYELLGPEAFEFIPAIKNIDCFGDSTGEINLSVSYTNGPYTVQWNSGQTGQILTGLPFGNYMAIVTDSMNCMDSAEIIMTQPDSLKIIAGSVAALSGNSDGKAYITVTGGLLPYQIIWNDAQQQVTDTAFNLPTGDYLAIITDMGGCVDSIWVHVPFISGIQDFRALGYKIFPNPTGDKIHIEFNNALTQENVRLVNTFGQAVAVHSLIWKNRITLNLDNQAAGIYFLIIETPEGIITGRIMKTE